MAGKHPWTQMTPLRHGVGSCGAGPTDCGTADPNCPPRHGASHAPCDGICGGDAQNGCGPVPCDGICGGDAQNGCGPVAGSGGAVQNGPGTAAPNCSPWHVPAPRVAPKTGCVADADSDAAPGGASTNGRVAGAPGCSSAGPLGSWHAGRLGSWHAEVGFGHIRQKARAARCGLLHPPSLCSWPATCRTAVVAALLVPALSSSARHGWDTRVHAPSA